MKRLLIILSLVLGCLQPGYAQKPNLKFNKDGKFKIVQFTDVHYIHGNPKSAISIERINEVLDAEKPDLVLFTGDVIYGQPAEEGMRTILNLAANRKIPFGVTFGNHDNEQGLTRTQLFDIIQTIPYNLDRFRGRSRGGNQLYSSPEIVRWKERCSYPVLPGLTFIFTDQRDRRLRLHQIRPDPMVSRKQREIHETKRWHSPALVGIFPHRPAGIQPSCIRRNSHFDRNTKGKSLRSATQLRNVRFDERNG